MEGCSRCEETFETKCDSILEQLGVDQAVAVPEINYYWARFRFFQKISVVWTFACVQEKYPSDTARLNMWCMKEWLLRKYMLNNNMLIFSRKKIPRKIIASAYVFDPRNKVPENLALFPAKS